MRKGGVLIHIDAYPAIRTRVELGSPEEGKLAAPRLTQSRLVHVSEGVESQSLTVDGLIKRLLQRGPVPLLQAAM
ncbi:hypothetical protein PMm318_A38190 [Pseudomonas moorei]